MQAKERRQGLRRAYVWELPIHAEQGGTEREVNSLE
jgi:hypothetical protein